MSQKRNFLLCHKNAFSILNKKSFYTVETETVGSSIQNIQIQLKKENLNNKAISAVKITSSVPMNI